MYLRAGGTSQQCEKVELQVLHFQIIANVFSNEALPPKLVVHGAVLDSYNDGSFYIETRSSRRPTDWVKRDTYPRASVEVKPPPSILGKLMPFASVKESGTQETSSSTLKRRVKLSLSVQTVKPIIIGKKQIAR